MEWVVEFNQVWKRFSSRGLFGSKTVHALRGVTFGVKRGEVFAFLGPNGAGKTTALRILMGFLSPSEGDVTVFGKRPGAPSVKRRIGYLPESPRPPGKLKGDEYLEAMALLSGIPKKKARSESKKLLRVLDLENSAGFLIASYSKGMLQKLALASALIHDPELVVLDEPTSGLDPEGRSYVLNLVKSLKRRGKTIILSTHILHDIDELCDRVGLIVEGKVVRIFERAWVDKELVLVEYHPRNGNLVSSGPEEVILLAPSNGRARALVEPSFLSEFRSLLEREGSELLKVSSHSLNLEEVLTSEIRRYKGENR